MAFRNGVNKFFAEHLTWIPVVAELCICNPELELAGMVDALFYDVKTNEFVLADWKVNLNFLLLHLS